ncbi:MAG: NADH-dependent [FeFe] hydrogenase, group A6 [Spirochaetes bacterium]|jgi:NADP-reducing hydrogenase subunit HndD|nr:NADH-dependent [FeFe] hydrogenase, group A6 [Spirochaetota bacterium]
MFEITINDKKLNGDDSMTILDAAEMSGIKIPTLCFLKGFTPLGACRVCVVEVEGANTLTAACSTPLRADMVIKTHSPRVQRARQSVLELLLSEHEGDCKFCSRSDDCELQALALELGLEAPRFEGEKNHLKTDSSTAALVRDPEKCIKCRRCVAVCSQRQGVGALFPQYRGFATTIGPAFHSDLDSVTCVQCGQCVAVCPVEAISEKSHIADVLRALEDPEKHVIVQTAPAIRAALGECFGYPPGVLVTGKMTAALRRIGFNKVFDTNFSADLTIMEEGSELLQRLRTVLEEGKSAALPQFSSCSPGWINFTEHFFPEYIPNLSTCKSPQQMFGALAKTYYAQKSGIDPDKIVVVSVMPCTAKKFEAARDEMCDSGFRDVDYVLTTRELGKLIRLQGIDFTSLPDEEMDVPMGLSSGAADIFANSGGVMEAAIRTVYELTTGKELPTENLHITPLAGLDGIKEASLRIEGTKSPWNFLEGVELKVAVAHGLGNAAALLEDIKAGKRNYHFVEIMTCPGGCIGGGGQPRFTTDEVREKRIAAIYSEDEGKPLRKSHENPAITEIYAEFLGEPLGEKSHHLLHTQYTRKE